MIQQLVSRVPVLFKSVASQKSLDALEILQQDHMKVESLYMLSRLTRDKEQRKRLIGKIVRELESHARMEEEFFYPELEKHEELKDHVLESREEHKQIKTLLGEISPFTLGNERLEAKLKVLMEDVMHHVTEEENTLFPKVRRNLSPNQLERIAGHFRSKKKRTSSVKAA